MKRLFYFVLAIAGAVLSNPIDDVMGVSARVKSMGGAGSVLSDDFSAAFYNPANLPRCGSNKISLGYDFIQTNLKATNQLGQLNAANLGVCLLPVQNLGVGIYVSAGLGIPVDVHVQTVDDKQHTLLYGNSLRFPSIIAGVGYRFIPQLSVGVAASVHLKNVIDLGMNLPIAAPEGALFSTALDLKIIPVVSLIAGVTYEPVSRVKTSLIFRGTGYSNLQINADVRGDSVVKLPIGMILRAALDYSPMQLALGISYRPLDALTLAADVTYYRWSAFVSPFIRAEAAPNSPVSSSIPFPPDEKLHLHDTVVPRFGVEYRFQSAMAVRAGYAFIMSPTLVPIDTAKVFDDNVHRVTLGAGYRLVTSKELALNFDGMIGVDAMLQDATTGGTAVNAGLTLTAEY